MSEGTINEISRKISRSKKYHRLYRKTISRIVASCLKKNPQPKTAEKLARKVINQMWDAFGSSVPNYQKLLSNFQESRENNNSLQESLLPILSAQSSTQERLPILETFYKEIFVQTGFPSSIVDLGCGLNPLSISWMNLPDSISYMGFDIDTDEIAFLKGRMDLKNIIKTIMKC